MRKLAALTGVAIALGIAGCGGGESSGQYEREVKGAFHTFNEKVHEEEEALAKIRREETSAREAEGKGTP